MIYDGICVEDLGGGSVWRFGVEVRCGGSCGLVPTVAYPIQLNWKLAVFDRGQI